MSTRSASFAAMTVIALVLLLGATSPELSWDEAYRVPFTHASWKTLWTSFDVSHGPMSVYLAKLGLDVLPSGWGLELRARFFAAVFGAAAVALVTWALRSVFRASPEAAAVGGGVLMLSVIRTAETNIIGPHHLILFCVVLVVALGYRSLETPSPASGAMMGTVLGFGALSSTYILPVAVGWVIAAVIARKGKRERWLMVVTAAVTAIVILAVFWPPGLFRRHFVDDFLFYVHFDGHATLVGERIYAVAPSWSVPYWLVRLELPAIVAFAILLFRRRSFSASQKYLLGMLAFYLVLLLKAHVAGARNLLQFLGVLCLAIGALFDDVAVTPRAKRLAAAAILAVAVANFVIVTRSNHPYLATNGYAAFVRDNRERLSRPAEALVYGSPVLGVYADAADVDMQWDAREMPWDTGGEWTIAPSVRYVLMPAFVYESMPPSQPMRRVVAASWDLVWRFQSDDAWELRLYERPVR